MGKNRKHFRKIMLEIIDRVCEVTVSTLGKFVTIALVIMRMFNFSFLKIHVPNNPEKFKSFPIFELLKLFEFAVLHYLARL